MGVQDKQSSALTELPSAADLTPNVTRKTMQAAANTYFNDPSRARKEGDLMSGIGKTALATAALPVAALASGVRRGVAGLTGGSVGDDTTVNQTLAIGASGLQDLSSYHQAGIATAKSRINDLFGITPAAPAAAEPAAPAAKSAAAAPALSVYATLPPPEPETPLSAGQKAAADQLAKFQSETPYVQGSSSTEGSTGSAAFQRYHTLQQQNVAQQHVDMALPKFQTETAALEAAKAGDFEKAKAMAQVLHPAATQFHAINADPVTGTPAARMDVRTGEVTPLDLPNAKALMEKKKAVDAVVAKRKPIIAEGNKQAVSVRG